MLKRAHLILCAVALVALSCGAAADLSDLDAYVAGMDEGARSICELPCIGPVSAEVPVRCRDVGRNLIVARDALAGRPGHYVVPPGRFCEVFENTSLAIKNDPHAGHMLPVVGGITIDIGALSLAHELEHVWAWEVAGAPGSLVHEGWSTNGYDAAARAYEARRYTLVRATQTASTSGASP